METALAKLVEYTVDPFGRLVGRHICYVIYCKSYIKTLREKMDELKAARRVIQNEFGVAEEESEQVQPDVELWLARVHNITVETDKFLEDKSQAKLKCLYGFCLNLTTRHRQGRKSTKLAEKIVELHKKREFSKAACRIPKLNEDQQAYVSSMSRLNEEARYRMDNLNNPNTQQAYESSMSRVNEEAMASWDLMDSLKNLNTHGIGLYGVLEIIKMMFLFVVEMIKHV